MSARKATALTARIAELGITSDELAAILRRDPAEVEEWVTGDADPDAEARVLLRLVMDPERTHAAQLAAERIRSKRTQGWGGEDWQSDGKRPSYGSGHTGATGGQPV